MAGKLLPVVLTCLISLLSLIIPNPAFPEEKKTTSQCKAPYPSDSLLEWDCITLKKGDTLEKLFAESWKDVARFNRIDRRHAVIQRHIKAPKNPPDIKDFTPLPKHYKRAEGEAKFILVDLTEEFLGAYEYGDRVFSAPVATGEKERETPAGEFRITAFHIDHESSKYTIEKTDIPYPMGYALRFYISRDGISFWIHGRDLPGYPASHGCIGLYDEEMQKEYYGYPPDPVLEDAKALYNWVLGDTPDDGNFHTLEGGPRVLIIGATPDAREKAF